MMWFPVWLKTARRSSWYTDIERDGMQIGVNVPALTHLAQTSKVPVIAAGGVATFG